MFNRGWRAGTSVHPSRQEGARQVRPPRGRQGAALLQGLLPSGLPSAQDRPHRNRRLLCR